MFSNSQPSKNHIIEDPFTERNSHTQTDKKTWSEIDGTIDSVLASTRSGNPDSSKCLTALNDSLSALNTANE